MLLRGTGKAVVAPLVLQQPLIGYGGPEDMTRVAAPTAEAEVRRGVGVESYGGEWQPRRWDDARYNLVHTISWIQLGVAPI